MSQRRGYGNNRLTTSVFIRNLHHECRQDDLRKIFQKYGDISDVYIPLDYHTRTSRGFAYVQFNHLEDAEDAVYYLDGTSLFGRALEIQVAQGDRKSPAQMRYRGGGTVSGGGGGRRRGRSYSRSRSRSRSPRRSGGGGGGGAYRERASRGERRSRSRSRSKSRSPPTRRSRSASKSKSRSKSRSKSKSR